MGNGFKEGDFVVILDILPPDTYDNPANKQDLVGLAGTIKAIDYNNGERHGERIYFVPDEPETIKAHEVKREFIRHGHIYFVNVVLEHYKEEEVDYSKLNSISRG